jgi:hypothetical protein
MRVSELFATEGYDTSSKNREWFYSGEYDDWKAAVKEAGAAVVKGKDEDKAEGWDGLCGEWDHGTEKGWLVDKWSKKPVKEAVDANLAAALDAKANGADEVTYKGVCYTRSGPKNAVSKPGKWRATVKEGKEFGAYYYEQLAKKLPAGLKGEAIISAGFKQAVADIGKIKAHHYFYYDEDFPSDLASSYEWYQKNKDTVKEEVGSKAWRAKVREQHGQDIKFFDDTVHQRIVAQKGPDKKIVATFDRKSGKPTIFSEGINGEYRAVHNRAGIAKKFMWIDGDWKSPSQVKDWLKNDSHPEAEKAAAKRAREFEKSMKPAREKKPEVDLQKVYNIVIGAIGDSFPDGDPIDHFAGPLRRMGVPEYSVMDYADKAMKKHGGKSEKKGVYAYLGDMWDDMAGDAMYDAKNGGEAREPFVRMENDKPVKQDNPWK